MINVSHLHSMLLTVLLFNTSCLVSILDGVFEFAGSEWVGLGLTDRLLQENVLSVRRLHADRQGQLLTASFLLYTRMFVCRACDKQRLDLFIPGPLLFDLLLTSGAVDVH